MSEFQLPDLNLKDLAHKVIYDQYRGKNVELLLNAIGKVIDANVGIIARTFETDLLSIKNSYGIGLDLWGRLVNFPRSVQFKDPDLNVKLEDENFISLENVDTDGTIKRGVLTDEAYRILLQLRLQTQNTLGTVPVMSAKISTILESNIAINDHLDMQFITFYIRDELPSWLDTLLADPDLDLLPRPAGTGTKVLTSVWRYLHFKYEGEPDKKLTNFFTSIFYDPKEDENAKPIYKTLVYYIDTNEYFKKNNFSWYDLNHYKDKLKADADAIKKEAEIRAELAEKIEMLNVTAEDFTKNNKDIIEPEVWTNLRQEVFQEYFSKKSDERSNMSEQWEIKNARLEYLIAKRRNHELQELAAFYGDIDTDKNIFYMQDLERHELVSNLYYNQKDGFYYTDSNFRIENITALCKLDGYNAFHFGMDAFFEDYLGFAFSSGIYKDKPRAAGAFTDDVKYEDLPSIYEGSPLKKASYHLNNMLIEYYKENPFYDHWLTEFSKKVSPEDPLFQNKIEYEFTQGQVPGRKFKQFEVLFNLFYIGMMAYRNALQESAFHFINMKRCFLTMTALTNCENRFILPKNYKRVTQIATIKSLDEYDPKAFPLLINYYQHNALLYRKASEDLKGENHASVVADTYELLADNIQLESNIANLVKKHLTKWCKEVVRSDTSYVSISQLGIDIMKNSVKRLTEQLKSLGKDDLISWVENHFNNCISKLMDKQKEYINNFNNFENECKDFIDYEKYNRKIEEYGKEMQNCESKLKDAKNRLKRTEPRYNEIQLKVRVSEQAVKRHKDWYNDRWTRVREPICSITDYSYFQSRCDSGNEQEKNYMEIDMDTQITYYTPTSPTRAYKDNLWKLMEFSRNSRGNVNKYKGNSPTDRWQGNLIGGVNQLIPILESRLNHWKREEEKFYNEVTSDKNTVSSCQTKIAEKAKLSKELTENRMRYIQCVNIMHLLYPSCKTI